MTDGAHGKPLNCWPLALTLVLLVLLSAGPAVAQPFAYVTNGVTDNVSVIDTATNVVVATVAVGTNAAGVAVNPSGTQVYVSNAVSNNVSVIDATSNTVVATVAVGATPLGVAVTPDGTRVYVANGNSDNVSVIDTTTFAVVATVTLPTGSSPAGVTAIPAANRVYVGNQNAGNVSVINTNTNTVMATVTAGVGPRPLGLWPSPDGTRVYVANGNAGTVSVIDTNTNLVVSTVTVGNTPNGVTGKPDGTRVYVGNILSTNVSVIDTTTSTPAVVATVNVGQGPGGLAVTPDGKRVYVPNFILGGNPGTVSVIDTGTNTVLTTVTVGIGPNVVAIAPCASAPSGMVGWWPLDETTGATTVKDIIGGNNGTPQQGPIGSGPPNNGPAPGISPLLSPAAVVGGSLYFYGPAMSVRVPNAASLNFGTGDFSIDAWVYPIPVNAVSVQPIVDKTSSGGIGYRLFILNGQVHFVLNGQTVAQAPVSYAQWQHVAVVRKGGTPNTVEIYIGGQLASSSTPTVSNSLTSTADLLIGGIVNPAAFGGYGEIGLDELEIFNRALLRAEIQTIANARSAGKCRVAASTGAMPVPTGPTSISNGGTACFPLQQAAGAFPVVSSNPALARPLGETVSGNNYSWRFALGAFAGLVDIYLAIVPPTPPVLFLRDQPPLTVSTNVTAFTPATVGPLNKNPLFTIPLNLIPPGTYVGHVFVLPSGTNPATFNLVTSPYYHWCFQRTF